jgi:macrolide-specific efflux system membrane fusion protein
MNIWRSPMLKGLGFMALLAVLAAAVIWRELSTQQDTTAQAPSVAVERGDLQQQVLASGVVQPRLKVDVSAQVSGQVLTLHVKPGDAVAEGDLLVSLNPELARNEVAQARANVAQQLASMASRQIDESLAQREAARQRTLFKGQATSAVELEKAEAELSKIQSDIAGLEATLGKQQADLANARLKRNFTQVTAPISGEVASVLVQKGQAINANYQTPVLLTLVKLDVMTIRTLVAEADIRLVRVGQRASFATLGDSLRQHEGVVRLIQPLPEKVNSAVFYNVMFDVANTGPTRADWPLMSEMTGQVRIQIAQVTDVPTLPLIALGERGADGSYAVQVVPAGAGQSSPETRRIRVGINDNTRVQVLDGLQPGERVRLPAAPASAPPSH